MLELRRRQYPDPGAGRAKANWRRLEAIESRRDPPALRAAISTATARSWAWRAGSIGRGCGTKSAGCLAIGSRSESAKPLEGQHAARAREHCRHESNQTQIGIAYPSVPYRHPDYFQASGAVGVLSGGMSSRLFTEVREKRGLCYTVYASHHTLRDRASVLCYAGTSAQRAQETLDVMLGELLRLAERRRARTSWTG